MRRPAVVVSSRRPLCKFMLSRERCYLRGDLFFLLSHRGTEIRMLNRVKALRPSLRAPRQVYSRVEGARNSRLPHTRAHLRTRIIGCM